MGCCSSKPGRCTQYCFGITGQATPRCTVVLLLVINLVCVTTIVFAGMSAGTERWLTVTESFVGQQAKLSVTNVGLFEACTTGKTTTSNTLFCVNAFNSDAGNGTRALCPDGKTRDNSNPDQAVASTKGLLITATVLCFVLLLSSLTNLVYPMMWLWITQIPISVSSMVLFIAAPAVFTNIFVKDFLCGMSPCGYSRDVQARAGVIVAANSCTEEYGYSMVFAGLVACLSGTNVILCCVLAYYAWEEVKPYMPAKAPKERYSDGSNIVMYQGQRFQGQMQPLPSGPPSGQRILPSGSPANPNPIDQSFSQGVDSQGLAQVAYGNMNPSGTPVQQYANHPVVYTQ